MFLDNRTVHGAQLGAGGVERLIRRQPAEELRHPMHTSVDHRRVEMVWTGDDVGDDFGLLRIGNRRLEDADHGGRAVAEANGLADYRGVALESAGPEAIGEHRRTFGLRPVVVWSQ